ncbi:MAG TPA: response regulator transcription factor [Phycisphaerales bacterium]|nr:response regulator transcription factor [Phycisphaerales bacterium]
MNSDVPGVFLIDDSPLTTAWVSKILRARDDVRWLGSAASCAEAELGLAGQNPDVLILDLKIPGESTTGFIQKLRAASRRPFILMLSGYVTSNDVQRALSAGAWGYLGKEVGPEELVEAIHKTARGEVVFSDSARRAIMDL